MKTLYYNGVIYGKDYVPYDSLLVEDGFITKIGYDIQEEVNIKIDLENKIVLPSFIDAHSHITSLAMSFLQLDLSGCDSIKAIKISLISYYNKYHPSIINASNYDHNKLKELRHPTRFDIDDVIKDIPVVLVHNSNHFGVFNSKAIELLNLQTLDGFLQETEFVNAVKKVPLPSIKEILNCYHNAQEFYASYGITYVQDGMIVKEMLPIYKELLKSDLLYLDIFGYPNITEHELIANSLKGLNEYFHLGGYKVILDGSPQGKTAWMLTPYKDSNDCSNGLVSDFDLRQYFKICIKDNMQLLAHCNGDHASQQLIKIANEFSDSDLLKIRPVIIHAQLLNVNQLDDCVRLHLIPSFFVAHVYYFGDIHIKNFGSVRASKISPVKSSINKGLKPTCHQDTPVIKPNMFETIQISIERLTKDKVVLGSDERLSLKEALDTVTINAAAQYGIENECGSLESGKKASFIIVDQDPFNTPLHKIKDIKVLETYKNGLLIYKQP